MTDLQDFEEEGDFTENEDHLDNFFIYKDIGYDDDVDETVQRICLAKRQEHKCNFSVSLRV